MIQNKGKLPILVLAGTIVKGGKQDRQIGEDFVVPRDKQVDVSAFCVEQGRWNGTRVAVPEASEVTAFIDRMEVAAVQEAKSSGSQTQEVRKADEGYASELRYDFSDEKSAPPAKGGKPAGKKGKPSVRHRQAELRRHLGRRQPRVRVRTRPLQRALRRRRHQRRAASADLVHGQALS